MYVFSNSIRVYFLIYSTVFSFKKIWTTDKIKDNTLQILFDLLQSTHA